MRSSLRRRWERLPPGWRGAPGRWSRVAAARLRRWAGLVAGVAAILVLVPLGVWIWTGSSDSALDATGGAATVGGLLCALLLSSGGFASQRRSGAAILWLQKPVSPAWLYLDRFIPRLGLAVLTVLAVAAVLGGAGVLAGRTVDPSTVVSGGVRLALLFSVLAGMVHAASCLGLPREELLGLATFLGGSWLAATTGGDPGASWLVRVVAVPVDSAELAGRALAGQTSDAPWLHLARITGYVAAWLTVATLASLFTTRFPMGRADD